MSEYFLFILTKSQLNHIIIIDFFVRLRDLIVEYKGDKLNINVIDRGQGEVILLLHGWGARAEIYHSVINPVCSHYRVIAPDLPGFGSSDEPSFAYSVEDYAGFICELLKSLGINKVHLMGHSHGGRTAIELATGNYDIEIGKMVLLDSAGIPAKKTFSKTARIQTYKLLKKLVLLKPIKKLYPDGLDKLQKKFGSSDYGAASAIMRQSMVKVLNTDYTDRLCKVKSPTLLIWGTNDTATPLSDGVLMEKLIPDAGLVKIEGAGHFSFAEKPALTDSVLKSFFEIV